MKNKPQVVKGSDPDEWLGSATTARDQWSKRHAIMWGNMVELAIAGLIVHLGVSHAEAAKILLSRLAAKMKPAAIKAALKS